MVMKYFPFCKYSYNRAVTRLTHFCPPCLFSSLWFNLPPCVCESLNTLCVSSLICCQNKRVVVGGPGSFYWQGKSQHCLLSYSQTHRGFTVLYETDMLRVCECEVKGVVLSSGQLISDDISEVLSRFTKELTTKYSNQMATKSASAQYDDSYLGTHSQLRIFTNRKRRGREIKDKQIEWK